MPDYQVPSLESAISGPLNFDPICPDENIGTDRRIRKTRQRLQAALLLLMKEEPLSQITMREVCRRADVGRSTPYSHFRDVEDILDQLEATFFQALSQLLDAYPAHADMEEKAQWFVQLFILARRHGLYLCCWPAMCGRNSSAAAPRYAMPASPEAWIWPLPPGGSPSFPAPSSPWCGNGCYPAARKPPNRWPSLPWSFCKRWHRQALSLSTAEPRDPGAPLCCL